VIEILIDLYGQLPPDFDSGKTVISVPLDLMGSLVYTFGLQGILIQSPTTVNNLVKQIE